MELMNRTPQDGVRPLQNLSRVPEAVRTITRCDGGPFDHLDILGYSGVSWMRYAARREGRCE
jgi:hypothetical protein